MRRRYLPRIARRQSAVEKQTELLERFCRRNRDRLFPSGRKSLKTQHGSVGFRKSPPRVVRRDGADAGEVCRMLQGHGLGHLLRTERKPHKTAIKRAWRDGRVTQEQLARCALKVEASRERFFLSLRAPEGVERAGAGR